jgi:hypothetical protein
MGAGALPSGESLDSIAWKSNVLNREETLATISTTFASGFPTVRFHLSEFKGVVGWEPRRAHLLLRQVIRPARVK